jgi:hypothetical protein
MLAPDTNSNSAAFAIANQSQRIVTGNQNSTVNDNSIDLTLPGAASSGKVTFQCNDKLLDLGGCE